MRPRWTRMEKKKEWGQSRQREVTEGWSSTMDELRKKQIRKLLWLQTREHRRGEGGMTNSL